MKASDRPYALPHGLERDLARVHAFWEGLKRHEAETPFWDDGNFGAARPRRPPEMVEAFDKPARFRVAFGLVGADIKQRYGGDLAGSFDEIDVCNAAAVSLVAVQREGGRPAPT